jgi:hypothetical protein
MGSGSREAGGASPRTGGACRPSRTASLPTRRGAVRTMERVSPFTSGTVPKRWGIAPKG